MKEFGNIERKRQEWEAIKLNHRICMTSFHGPCYPSTFGTSGCKQYTPDQSHSYHVLRQIRAYHLVSSGCFSLLPLFCFVPHRGRRYVLHLDQFLHRENLARIYWRMLMVDSLHSPVYTEGDKCVFYVLWQGDGRPAQGDAIMCHGLFICRCRCKGGRHS